MGIYKYYFWFENNVTPEIQPIQPQISKTSSCINTLVFHSTCTCSVNFCLLCFSLFLSPLHSEYTQPLTTMGAAKVIPENPLQAVPILSRESSFSSSPRRYNF